MLRFPSYETLGVAERKRAIQRVIGGRQTKNRVINIVCVFLVVGETNGTGPVVELWFDQPTEIDRVAMKEDLRLGERSLYVTRHSPP